MSRLEEEEEEVGGAKGRGEGQEGQVEVAIYHNATAAAEQRANPKDSEAAG